MRKLPLVYAEIRINDVDPKRERPFEKDHQDFQHNMLNLEGRRSATTTGGWTCSNTIRKSNFRMGTVGGRNSSKGE